MLSTGSLWPNSEAGQLGSHQGVFSRFLVERFRRKLNPAWPNHGSGLGVHPDLFEEGGVAWRSTLLVTEGLPGLARPLSIVVLRSAAPQRLELAPSVSIRGINPANRTARVHFGPDEVLDLLLSECAIGDFVGQRCGDYNNALRVANKSVAWHYQNAAAPYWHIHIDRMMQNC